jgi:hypothetical protein
VLNIQHDPLPFRFDFSSTETVIEEGAAQQGEPTMKKIIQLLNAQIAHHFCSFHCAVPSRSLTNWLVILGNLTVLSASLDAQTPTPTPIQTVLFAPVPANDNTGIGIGKFDAVTGAVINAILSPN